MTVYEFCQMCIEPSILNVEIFDGEIVYSGPADEIPEEYEDVEVSSFDLPTTPDWITINIF